MKIQTFSYRYAQEILEHPYYVDAFNELMDICTKCPLPVYKDKSKSQPKFEDAHTDKAGCTDVKRAFFMGNALVVGIVEGLGKALRNEIEKD